MQSRLQALPEAGAGNRKEKKESDGIVSVLKTAA
jgi:hypothetical protein